MEEIGAVFILAAIVFGVILAVAWIVLPFALIGTKPLLRELIAEARKTNSLLEERNTLDQLPAVIRRRDTPNVA